MATVQEVIRRLSIETTTKGVDEATSKLKQLEAGYKGVTVEGQKSETATQSSERRFASIQRQYDQNYRAVMQLAKVERDLSTAMGQGLLSLERKNELMALAARRYLDTAAAAQKAASAESASASQRASALQVQQWAGLRGPADVTRGADIAAYGRELDNLRAKYNPLFAANRQYYDTVRELNDAVKVGAISERERSTAMERAKNVYLAQSKSIREIGTSAGFSSFQVTNLGYQLNDIVSGLAMGQSPFMIMAQQGGQVYQILGTHPQGVGGAIRQVGSLLGGLVTPARLATGGIFAFGFAGVKAANDFLSAQMDVRNALIGVGTAAGITVDAVNKASAAANVARTSSESALRSAATTLGATGRISAEGLTEATIVAKDLAVVLGTDVAGSADVLAKAFRDPARAALELNERLGAINGATYQNIKNLQEQGRLQEASLALVRAINEVTKGGADNLTGWSRAWSTFSADVSNLWAKFGRGTASLFGIADEQQRLRTLQAELKRLESINFFGMKGADIAVVRQEIERTQKALEQAALNSRDIKTNLDSMRALQLVDQIMPEINQRQQLENRKRFLESINPEAWERSGRSVDVLTEAYQRNEQQLKTWLSTHDRAMQSLKIQMDAVGARSPAQLAEVARQQMRLSLAGTGISESKADEQINRAGALAYKQALQQIIDAQRDRRLSSQLAIQQSEVELQTIGKTVREAELLRLNWQTYSDLRREAERNNTSFDEAEYERIKRNNTELARRKELIAVATLRNDLSFDRDQLGRTDMDATIASRLRGAGLPVDLSSSEASLIRINEQLKLSRDLVQDFAGTFSSEFRSALRDGQNFWESFSSAGLKALNRLADRLMDLAIQNLVAKAFGGSGFNLFGLLSSGVSGGASGGMGSAAGGMAFQFHDGGMAGYGGVRRYVHPAYFDDAPRYHSGGVAGLRPNEIAAVLERGEEVLRRDDPRHRWNGPVSSRGSAAQNVHVTAEVFVNEDGQWEARVKNISQSVASGEVSAGIESYDRSLPDRVQQIEQSPRWR